MSGHTTTNRQRRSSSTGLRRVLPAFLLAAVLGQTADAAIRYVNAARPDDSGNGLSWIAAKKTLQAALADANSGDEVWVAAGVYKPDQGGGQSPGNRSASFQLETGVEIYGGFAGTETSLSQRDIAANPTILSGDLSGNDTDVACSTDSDCAAFGSNCFDGACNISAGNGENSFHVVRGSGAVDATLDGFTVTAGNSNGGSPNDQGGGMFTNAGSPTAANCLFTRNFASFRGGGMYNSSNGTMVRSCDFVRNSCGGGGGGGMVNHSSSTATVAKCTFRENASGGEGGGLHSVGNSTTTVLNCSFYGNSATIGGGYALVNSFGPTANCAFSGNSATNGAGMSIIGSATLTNATFSRNTASSEGGGIYTNGSPTVRNSILWENSDGGGMDESAQMHAAGGAPVVNYSIVQGGWTGDSGPGNVVGDPLLIDADGADNVYGTPDDDLGLGSGSPAIDSGNSGHLLNDFADLDEDGNTSELIPIDAAGDARQVDDPFATDTGVGPAPVVDMGAYEAPGNPIAYVHAGATGANTGESWSDAFTHLQSALALAAANPMITEIWVAEGDYLPDGGRRPVQGVLVTGSGDRSATFQLLNNLGIYGGFAGNETSLTERNPALYPTTLSGDLLGDDHPVFCQSSPDCVFFGALCVAGACVARSGNGENSFHVVTGSGTDSTAVLDGFTVAAGNLIGAGFPQAGGGLVIVTGSPIIRNCVFRDNNGGPGAGMYHSGGSAPVFARCAFYRNAGGAVSLNSLSNARFANCTFHGNSGTHGGAISASQSSPWLINCLFSGNFARFDGGALYNTNGSSPLMRNCTIVGNSAADDGGGIANVFGANNPQIANSILWNNLDSDGMDESAQVHTENGDPGAFFSVIQGGWSGTGQGNLADDPLLVDPDGLDNDLGTPDDNLRLRAASLAVDTANPLFLAPDLGDLDEDGNTVEAIPVDLAEQPRLNGVLDRGAYESFTDCNGNGIPDSVDIADGTSEDCDSNAVWHSNGIPDECDIAACDGNPACGDCNLNGVPDRCDIAFCQGGKCYFGTPDVNPADGIPDECGFFTGGCLEPGRERDWTCPDNWLLEGLYPDDEDSASGISVTLPAGSDVLLDETVLIPSLSIEAGALLDLVTHDTLLDVDAEIVVSGTLRMESCKLAANTPPTITVRPGGKVQTLPCTSPGPPSTLVATSVRILSEDCASLPCAEGGELALEEALSFTTFGDVIIDGSAADGLCDTLPVLSGVETSSTAVGGTLSLIGGAAVHFDSTVPVAVGGDFDNRSVRPECFDWIGGALLMAGGEQHRSGLPSLYEVAGADVGIVNSLSDEQVEFAMGAITVSSGADMAFVDAFDNDSNGQYPCSEALYVGALTVEPGAALTVVDCRIYYSTLSAEPSSITSIGCGELIALNPAPDPLAASTDPDKVRFISFVVPTSSPGVDTGLRVELTSLHHPANPPPGTPDFTGLEGQFRYVNSFGGSTTCVDSNTFATNYRCGQLGCQPEYRDWATELASATNPVSSAGLIHVTGDAVAPSSTLTVSHIAASCGAAPAADTCAAASTGMAVSTSRWGDVGGGGGAAPDGSANVIDIGLVVDNVKGLATAIPERRAWMKNPANPFNNPVNVIDIGLTVDAVKGLPYPYTISSCP